MKERRILLYLVLPASLLLVAVLIVTQDFFGDQGIDLGRPAPGSGPPQKEGARRVSQIALPQINPLSLAAKWT